MSVAALAVPQELVFDEAAHRYFLGGKEVPSVTTVLAQAGLVDWSFCSEWARERGSLVHRAIHLELTGGLDWSSVDEIFHPFISAAIQALRDLQAETIVVEHRVVSTLYGYAGTLDWIGRIDGVLSLMDWKTGPVVPAYALQTAAYTEAIHEMNPEWLGGNRIKRRYALRLHQDGTYQLDPFTDRDDITDFRAALRVVRWKKEHGL